jgi:hypothetical protein
MERSGDDLGPGDPIKEETYFIWSWIPIIGIEGTVKGYLNPNFETTGES